MAVRTGISTGDVHTFACGEVVSDSTLNTLQDLAKSMRERGDTVICQHGQLIPESEKPVLVGRHGGVDSVTYVTLENEWRFENAGYSKYVLDIKFIIDNDSVGYTASADDTFFYTRIVIQHTDKAGGTAVLWDSEIESPTVASVQTATTTGTFSNPPASGESEIEKITAIAYSNRSATSTTVNTAFQSGLISISLKIYDDI